MPPPAPRRGGTRAVPTGAPHGTIAPGITDAGWVNGSSREFSGSVYKVSSGGGTTAPGPHVFTLPQPVYAFGADFAKAVDAGLLTLTVSGVTIELDNHLPDPGNGFLGVTSDTAFSTATFDLEGVPGIANEFFFMDDVSFPGGDVIPEPATLSLLAAGVLAFAARRRRR